MGNEWEDFKKNFLHVKSKTQQQVPVQQPRALSRIVSNPPNSQTQQAQPTVIPKQSGWRAMFDNTDQTGREAYFSPTQIVNDVYASYGGAGAVLDAKKLDPQYNAYTKIASSLYNEGDKISKNDKEFLFPEVNKYNTKLIENDKSRKVNYALVPRDTTYSYDQNGDFVNIDDSDIAAGRYDDTLRRIEIVDGNKNSQKAPFTNINRFDDIPTLLHENAHAIQGTVLKPTANPKREVNEADPIELHATAAALNQSYMNSTGKPLVNSKDVDVLLDNLKIINDKHEKSATKGETGEYKAAKNRREYYGQKHGQSGRISVQELISNKSNRIAEIPEFKKLGKLHPDIVIQFDFLYQSEPVQRYIKANPKNPNAWRDAVKALIMTTAKNDQKNSIQENRLIDNGWEIS